MGANHIYISPSDADAAAVVLETWAKPHIGQEAQNVCCMT